jgi:hypothetical protein
LTQPAIGRFAMIDDGIGLQLVPWRQRRHKRFGQHIGGVVRNVGGTEWRFGRQRGLSALPRSHEGPENVTC